MINFLIDLPSLTTPAAQSFAKLTIGCQRSATKPKSTNAAPIEATVEAAVNPPEKTATNGAAIQARPATTNAKSAAKIEITTAQIATYKAMITAMIAIPMGNHTGNPKIASIIHKTCVPLFFAF